MGDNKTVIEWANANFEVLNPFYKPKVAGIWVNLWKMGWHGARPPATGNPGFCMHAFREHNTQADANANRGRIEGDFTTMCQSKDLLQNA